MDEFVLAASEEAKHGLAEGGIPIGSVLVLDGRITGRGDTPGTAGQRRVARRNGLPRERGPSTSGRLPPISSLFHALAVPVRMGCWGNSQQAGSESSSRIALAESTNHAGNNV